MLGASRESLAAVREALPGFADRPGFADASSQVLSVATLLDDEPSLRGVLADAGTDTQARIGIVQSVLTGKVDSTALEIVTDVVGRRWSKARDLVDVLGLVGADIAFISAERDGRLDAVQDELFRFGRAVVGDGRLQLVLGDPGVAGDQRAGVVGTLLEGQAQPETIALLEDAVAHPRGRRVEDAVNELVEQAAVRRERLLAEVRVAVSMTPDQETRLATALARIYGRQVQLQVIIDPEVLGGVDVRIGDEVIDGTIAHRLEQAERLVVGGQG